MKEKQRRVYEKAQGSCGDCAGYNDLALCDELPDCSCLIGERGEPVEHCWKEGGK